MSRDATKKMLDMVAEGSIDKDTLIRDLLGWMSEDDVREFVERNDYVGCHDEEDEDETPDLCEECGSCTDTYDSICEDCRNARCVYCGQHCDGECDEALAGGFQDPS